MIKLKKVILLLLSLFIVNQAFALEQNTKKDTITTFVYPSIPMTLRDAEARANYLIKHYWDQINFKDTNYIHHPEVFEQGVVNYIDLLKRFTTAEEANDELVKLFNKAKVEKKIYTHLFQLTENYLSDYSSPLKEEELYIMILKKTIQDKVFNSTEIGNLKRKLTVALKNRKGSVATNFTTITHEGNKNKMHNIQSPHLLLFFYDPDCPACEQAISLFKGSKLINQLIAQKKLTILAIYCDEFTNEWKRNKKKIPSNWIDVHNPDLEISNQELYVLKGTPTLYLLDQQKKVLLKDVPPEAILDYLSKK